MKLLGTEEDELAEGDGERAGQLGETEGRRIAAEKKIQDELLAGSNAGDETSAVLREGGGNRVVRRTGVIGESLERRGGRKDRGHGRRISQRRVERETEIRRLARLARSEEVAGLLSATLRRNCDLIATRDKTVHHRPDPNHRFLHRQFGFPFR